MEKPFFIVCFSLLVWGCDSLPMKQDLTTISYSVIDQDSVLHIFPQDFSGKVTLVSYIYTHCPDVCPLITANMKKVARELGSTDQVQFVGISFDPKRDSPQVLKKYAKTYELGSDNWYLLTGDKSVVDSLLADLDIEARQSYTRFSDEGSPIYYMNHTDRITLLDAAGRIREQYPGSQASTREIVADIDRLLTKTKN